MQTQTTTPAIKTWNTEQLLDGYGDLSLSFPLRRLIHREVRSRVHKRLGDQGLAHYMPKPKRRKQYTLRFGRYVSGIPAGAR